ncbi:hypothetical protein L2D08_19675 [Domibacillus sp. PGB-M46]|uniref:hypothetical protein n=1 Tax=Domibacillus sp. PGB-M46 TaxID=2910255 RepID=UPI001F5A5AF5|nr:hypothetical protein [Domibacillus sp. PGB-M46]MCI2256560.1 hypothetical protein [Domibacillus sp. PGB-M46]
MDYSASLHFVQLQEWQAKTFTLHFCMPTFMLEKLDLLLDKRLAVNKAAELFNVEYFLRKSALLSGRFK